MVLPEIVGMILMGITLGYLAIFAKRKEKDLWEAIKGDDGKLQMSEAVIAVWLVLWPVVVLGTTFLGIEPNPNIIWGMDLVLLVVLGIKGYKDGHINK